MESKPSTWDARRTQLVMTTRNRRDLLEQTLRSLAGTRLPATLWLVDDASEEPPRIESMFEIFAGSAVRVGGLLLNRERRRQAGAFNQGYALAADYVRQERQLRSVWLCKLEDDFTFHPDWLVGLLVAWHDRDVRAANVGMLGAANGELGDTITRIDAGSIPRTVLERYDIDGERGIEFDVIACQHVGAGCMFASLPIWEQLMPVPPREGVDVNVAADCASSVDWYLTGSGLRSINSIGMTCGRIIPELLTHIGDGRSTWRPK